MQFLFSDASGKLTLPLITAIYHVVAYIMQVYTSKMTNVLELIWPYYGQINSSTFTIMHLNKLHAGIHSYREHHLDVIII